MNTQRDRVYAYICAYADEHNGPTPSIREIAAHFDRGYTTIYRHVQRLIEEGRLEMRNGKLSVRDARWTPPQ